MNKKGVLVVKWGGNCKICVEKGSKKANFKDILSTTSNFNTHINSAHPLEASSYKDSLVTKAKKQPGQLTLAQAFSRDSLFSKNDERQVAITDSVVENLIIGLCLPMYTVIC